jgi:HlyD family secretion protein
MLPMPVFHDDEDLFDDASVTRSRRRLLRIVLLIVLLLLLLMGTVLVLKLRTHPVYQAQRVTSGDLALTVRASGLLHTNIYTVNFMGSGKLTAINVNIGQQVKKNQILAKLDPTSLQNALNEAQANVEAARTALDNANMNYDAIRSSNTVSAEAVAASNVNAQAASANSSRSAPGIGSSVNPSSLTGTRSIVAPTRPLLIGGGVDNVRTTEAQGQIKLAQKALALAQTKVTTAQYNLNNAILRAPHDGTIAALNGAVGGEPAVTFIQIVDASSLQLQVNVDEAHIGAVSIGDAVSFTVDAYPGQSFVGTVVTVLPLGQATSGRVTYPVLIVMMSVVPASVHLFPDMTAHATITTRQRSGVVLVPARALVFARAAVNPSQMQKALARAKMMVQKQLQGALEENPQPAVVLERDVYAKISVIPIVVGMTNGTEYEVLDGLSVGNVVLVGA